MAYFTKCCNLLSTQRINLKYNKLWISTMGSHQVNFFIVKDSPKYSNDIINFLRRTFFNDEPVNQSVGLCNKDEGHPELELEVLKHLEEEKSFMASAEDKNIVGVCINFTIRKSDLQMSLDALTMFPPDSAYRKICQFFYEENLKLDLFARFNVNEIFELGILAVDPKYRKQYIGHRLLHLSLENAKNLGIKVAKVDVTSIYSQKIAESIGFKTVKEIIYAQYLNSNGIPIFNVKPPHKSLKIMYKLLND